MKLISFTKILSLLSFLLFHSHIALCAAGCYMEDAHCDMGDAPAEMEDAPSPSTHQAQKRKFNVTLTPQKPKRASARELPPEPVPRRPLTEIELKTLIQYHKKHYPWDLMDHDFYKQVRGPGAESPLEGVLSYYLDEEAESSSSEEDSSDEETDDPSAASVPPEMSQAQARPEEKDVHHFMFYEIPYSDGSKSHWSAIYLHKRRIDGRIFVFFLDSLGLEGSVDNFGIRGSYVKNTLASFFRTTNIAPRQLARVSFHAYVKRRQADDESCALFTLNDLRALSRSLYTEERNPCDLLLQAAVNSQRQAIKRIRFSIWIVEGHYPPMLLQQAQRYSMIEAAGGLRSPHSPREFCYDHEGADGRIKRRNGFIQFQWRQVHEILKTFKPSPRDLGFDADHE